MKRRASADALPLVEDDELGVDVDPSWRDVIAPQCEAASFVVLRATLIQTSRFTP